jgi:hypothetical protein
LRDGVDRAGDRRVSRLPESLVRLIEASGDAGRPNLPAVVQWLLAASEAERLSANDEVRQRLHRLPARSRGGSASRHNAPDEACLPALRLAGVGTASTAQQAVDALDGWEPPAEPVARVLAARKPAWLAEFVESWSRQAPQAARASVDLLVEAGLARRPVEWAGSGRAAARLRLVGPPPRPAGVPPRVAEQLERLTTLELIGQYPDRIGLAAVRAAARQGEVPDIGELAPVLSVPLPPPITDPAELVRLFGQLIEADGSPVLVQRVLAGAVRTAGLPLPDRAAMMGPLLDRAWSRSVPHADTAGRHPGWSYLAALAFSWGTGWRMDYRHFQAEGGGRGEWLSSPDHLPPSRLAGVLGLQVAECTRLISTGVGRQLLSEPSHLSGAVEPELLLRRLRGYDDGAAGRLASAVQLDVELAALRLPRGLGEGFWREARAGCAPVAGRLRHHYAEQREPALRPVVGVPPGHHRQRDRGRPVVLAELADDVADASPADDAPDASPSGIWAVLTDLHDVIGRFEQIMGAFGFFEYDQQAATWSMIAPWHHELLSAHLLMPLARAVQAGNSAAPVVATLLDSPTGAFGPIAHVALVAALQGDAPQTRDIAADAWLATAGDGRLQPGRLAEALVLLARGQALRLDRVVRTVRPTTYEPITGYRALQALVAALPELLASQPPGLIEALELAAELAGRYGIDLIPAELAAEFRQLAAGDADPGLVSAAGRLTELGLDAPDRPLAVEAALEGLLGRLSGQAYSYLIM